MSKLEQIHALGESKRKRITRVSVKPKGMKSLAADFKPQKEIVGTNKKRLGRPLDSEAHLANENVKPWVAEKMSRRTWYRRQAKKRSEK